MLIGVVEGFYGSPWDFIDRLSMIFFMSRVGMNLYVYAPKDDPYHRMFWRSPYPASYMEEFSRLIDASNRYGVVFSYAISPGLDINYSSKTDIDVLVRKLSLFTDLGVRILGIFLDDIPPELRGEGFKSLAEAQAKLVNKVYHELSPDKIIFVPTFYWGYEKDYLRELGEILERNIEIVWTGKYVVSPTITLEDIDYFREISGRYPSIWDNYPVNDFFTVRGVQRLHLDYIKGRDPEIFSRISVYMSNPMNQAEASKIPLYTIARLAKRYKPGEKDLDKAIELIANEEVWESLKIFIRLNRSSVLDPEADYEPSREDVDKIRGMIKDLRSKLTNIKLLVEISPILSFLETLSSALEQGREIYSRRVQSAGLYDPPLTEEAMNKVFGGVSRRIPKWLKITSA
ncbi:MAG: protein O-GlcNAcase [Sulfolobales archaeon]|mgnify:CR=1 FL=1